MALKNRTFRITLNASLFLIILLATFFQSRPASALNISAPILPNFSDFRERVENGDQNALRGVYVPDVLALPVVQQPSGSPGYVSNNDGQTTQFRMASRFGNIGLLAHNHLSGKYFSQLEIGQKVHLVYGDGRVEYFIVTEVLQYQALQPNSPYSSFRNLDSRNEILSAEQMFKRVYFGDHHLTFQTCIEAEGNLSWGRLFVIAMPKP